MHGLGLLEGHVQTGVADRVRAQRLGRAPVGLVARWVNGDGAVVEQMHGPFAADDSLMWTVPSYSISTGSWLTKPRSLTFVGFPAFGDPSFEVVERLSAEAPCRVVPLATGSWLVCSLHG